MNKRTAAQGEDRVALHNEPGRVSTLEQTLALQHDSLTPAVRARLHRAGWRADRPGWEEALQLLPYGQDTLAVWRLDRGWRWSHRV